MFFQRKKKRLLRELWRSRLAKPPSLPLSDYYGPCSPNSGGANRLLPPRPVVTAAQWRTTGGDDNGFCCDVEAEMSITKMTRCVRTRSGVTTRNSRGGGGGGGFCLMGHCCGDAQSTCSSVSMDQQSVDSNHIYADEEAEDKAYVAFLGKTLAQRQLEALLESANARTTTTTSATKSACVLIRRQEAMNWSEDLHVIACRMWRWADLDMRTDVLKRIPSCPNGKDPVYSCCNPSHWFRVLQPGECGGIIPANN